MSNNNESINVHQDYFEFLKENGEPVLNKNGKPMLALRKEYRGEKSDNYPASEGDGTELELPEMLFIPETIDDTTVEALAPGIFANNNRVKCVTLPSKVTTLPAFFCRCATNLREVCNTGNITHIGTAAFRSTRLKEIQFPGLTDFKNVTEEETTSAVGAFAGCAYLEAVYIGNVAEIPKRTFWGCALLREVDGGENVTSIGEEAFAQTRNLTELPLLEHVTSVEKGAFFYSRITEYTLPEDDDPDQARFPTSDNGSKIFWEDVEYTPCENRIVTKLSQVNADWTEKTFLTNYGVKYKDGCALFSVMHIHSAITGKRYSHPDEFMEELRNDPKLSRFQYYGNWPGQFKNVAAMFEALGYRTEVHGNGSELSKENFQALLDALAQGAYVFSQVHSYEKWTNSNTEPDYDGGHAVVLYGVNNENEVRVLDSYILYEDFRKEGFEPDIDVYTYTMPYQNMVGATSDFVIVYPPETETDAE